MATIDVVPISPRLQWDFLAGGVGATIAWGTSHEEGGFRPLLRLLGAAIAAAMIALTCISCSNPRGTVITSSNADSIVDTVGPKLSDDDRKLLVEASARTTFGSYVMDGKTVGQVLNEQRLFDEQQSAKEAAEREEQLRTERERAAKIAKIEAALEVYPVAKDFQDANYDVTVGDVHNSAIEVTFKFKNKASKDIAAFKGTATFENSFGDVIESSELDYEHPIRAGSTVTWVGDLDYNQFEAKDQKMRDTPLSAMKFKWVPQGVTYTDGSQVMAPSGGSN